MPHDEMTKPNRLLPQVLKVPTQRDPLRPVIGVLPGCGIGPEVIGGALRVLSAVAEVSGIAFDVRWGGAIGEEAERVGGRALSQEVIGFCEEIFSLGGAVLNGPGGGRYVYDLRRRFDLFCKLAPVRSWPVLADAARVPCREPGGLDLLIVRDNCGGVYQGTWSRDGEGETAVARHAFGYRAEDVRRLAWVAARAALIRRRLVHVVVKDAGVPAVSTLWREVSGDVARAAGVEWRPINIDYAAYQLVRDPGCFDVILTPNLFGDILIDLAGVLQVSRGVTCSGNFDAEGHGVYQTNHGCAHDLAGTDTANPAGQILALAMLLRENFGLAEEAWQIESALAQTWAGGWRTADLAAPGSQVLGTRAMSEKVAERLVEAVAVAASLP